jgi:hypothetical protein
MCLAFSSWLATAMSLAVYSCKWHFRSKSSLFRDLCMYSPNQDNPRHSIAVFASRSPWLRPRTAVYCCQVASSFIDSLQTSTNDEVKVTQVRQRPLIRYGHMMPHTTLVCQHVNVSTVINLRNVQCISFPQSLLTELLFLCNQLFDF